MKTDGSRASEICPSFPGILKDNALFAGTPFHQIIRVKQ